MSITPNQIYVPSRRRLMNKVHQPAIAEYDPPTNRRSLPINLFMNELMVVKRTTTSMNFRVTLTSNVHDVIAFMSQGEIGDPEGEETSLSPSKIELIRAIKQRIQYTGSINHFTDFQDGTDLGTSDANTAMYCVFNHLNVNFMGDNGNIQDDFMVSNLHRNTVYGFLIFAYVPTETGFWYNPHRNYYITQRTLR